MYKILKTMVDFLPQLSLKIFNPKNTTRNSSEHLYVLDLNSPIGNILPRLFCHSIFFPFSESFELFANNQINPIIQFNPILQFNPLKKDFYFIWPQCNYHILEISMVLFRMITVLTQFSIIVPVMYFIAVLSPS